MPHDLVQVRNPKTGHWIKIDKTEGKVISIKKTSYKNIPIVKENETKQA